MKRKIKIFKENKKYPTTYQKNRKKKIGKSFLIMKNSYVLRLSDIF